MHRISCKLASNYVSSHLTNLRRISMNYIFHVESTHIHLKRIKHESVVSYSWFSINIWPELRSSSDWRYIYNRIVYFKDLPIIQNWGNIQKYVITYFDQLRRPYKWYSPKYVLKAQYFDKCCIFDKICLYNMWRPSNLEL